MPPFFLHLLYVVFLSNLANSHLLNYSFFFFSLITIFGTYLSMPSVYIRMNSSHFFWVLLVAWKLLQSVSAKIYLNAGVEVLFVNANNILFIFHVSCLLHNHHEAGCDTLKMVTFQDIYFEKQQGKKLLRKKLLPIDLQEKCRNIIPMGEVMPGLMQHLISEEVSTVKSSPASSSPPPGRLPRPCKWVIIDVIDDAYKKAVSIRIVQSIVIVL